MAYLATLEGETRGIDLNDLFDVNDYLGVKYFGSDVWNKIKKFACIITSTAANNPIIFFIDNIKNDLPPRPSELSECLFGFNDFNGRRAMGSATWNTVKSKIDSELLGFSITGALKSAGSAIKKGAGVVKNVASAPLTIGTKMWTDTPLKYTPGGIFAKNVAKAHEKVSEPVKSVTQMAVDLPSKLMYTAATKTPLKYTGYGLLTKWTEKAREASGISSPGTAQVYETQEEKDRKKAAAAAAAAKAASAASVAKSKDVTAAKKLEAQAEATAQAQAESIAAQQEAATTQQALEHANETLTSKYAPWVLGGAGLLVALSILKK